MYWFRELGTRLVMLLRRGQFDADLDEEMRLHRELREQEEIERGLSPEEVHYAVQMRFGCDLVLREKRRGKGDVRVKGALKPGVTLAQAEGDGCAFLLNRS